MNDINTPRFAYTAQEVADSLGLSVSFIRDATYKGLIACHRIGRAVRYTEEDIKAFLASYRDAGYS